MPKLIKNIVSNLDVEFESLIYSFELVSKLETLNNINIIQDLSKANEITELKVNSYGVKRKVYNNKTLIVDGNEL